MQLFADERGAIFETYGIRPWFTFLEDLARTPQRVIDDARVVCLQTGFDIDPAAYGTLVERLRADRAGVRLVHFDYTAPTDIRQARVVAPHADIYVKKHLLADRSRYREPTRGDTNLTD